MRYRIVNETKGRMRIHMYAGSISREQEEILTYAFSAIPGIRKVVVYRATGNCALLYEGDREEVVRRLDTFNFENVEVFAKKILPCIDEEEMARRKLSPELKNKLRIRIALETVADAALPLPLQLLYHAYQMITLKNI